MGGILNEVALGFNGSVKVEAREERLTSEAGAVVLREVDERLGLTRWLGEQLTDTRDEKRVVHSLRELVRTDLLLLAQGWRDRDDADALRKDAALRLAVSDSKSSVPLKGGRRREGGAGLAADVGRVAGGEAQRPRHRAHPLAPRQRGGFLPQLPRHRSVLAPSLSPLLDALV